MKNCVFYINNNKEDKIYIGKNCVEVVKFIQGLSRDYKIKHFFLAGTEYKRSKNNVWIDINGIIYNKV